MTERHPELIQELVNYDTPITTKAWKHIEELESENERLNGLVETQLAVQLEVIARNSRMKTALEFVRDAEASLRQKEQVAKNTLKALKTTHE